MTASISLSLSCECFVAAGSAPLIFVGGHEMRPNDRSRVQKEIKDILKDKASGVTVELRGESSIQEMVGSLRGPKDTPYEGGLFYVDIKLDDQYPFAPPKMKFSTSPGNAPRLASTRISPLRPRTHHDLLNILLDKLQKFGIRTSAARVVPYVSTCSRINGALR